MQFNGMADSGSDRALLDFNVLIALSEDFDEEMHKICFLWRYWNQLNIGNKNVFWCKSMGIVSLYYYVKIIKNIHIVNIKLTSCFLRYVQIAFYL
jgi:hypothetical protein